LINPRCPWHLGFFCQRFGIIRNQFFTTNWRYEAAIREETGVSEAGEQVFTPPFVAISPRKIAIEL